jgi:cytochrome P450
MSDPFAPAAQADPYPLYATLRAQAAVHWSERHGAWLVPRHADVCAVLRDDRWSGDYRVALQPATGVTPAGRVLLFMDPPAHTSLRRCLGRSLDARLIERLRPAVAEICTELLDALAGRREVDLIADFATVLPLRTLTRALGLPDADAAAFGDWAADVAALFDWSPAPESAERSWSAARELMPDIMRLVAVRRRAPQDDVVSGLLACARAGATRYADAATTAILAFAAGHMTTTNLLGNGALTVLTQPAAQRQLAGGACSPRTAVDELLRFDSPVQLTPRTARVDLKLGGRTIREGDRVLALLGSANRDERVFADASALNLNRRPNRHVAFGSGPHHCAGAQLARLVGEVGITALFSRFPDARLVLGGVLRRPGTTQRGLARLRMTPGAERTPGRTR